MLFLNLRDRGVGGGIVNPLVMESGVGGQLKPVFPDAFRARTEGRDILIATHGFNVSRARGVAALAALEQHLNPAGNETILGVLWPGDFWIPVINYPAEAGDAVTCGRLLAEFCNARLPSAASLSFLSHSLGGRLVLEAVSRLDRKARTVCVAAGAVDYDCLDSQYRAAADNAQTLVTLSSRKDNVLRLAYPLGDFASDIFYDDDSPFARALGRGGPKMPAGGNVRPTQIPDPDKYDHGDYLPSPGNPRWPRAADFMGAVFRGVPRRW